MELSREQPPSYVAHDPEELKLPSVPQQVIRSAPAPSDLTLPDLRTVLANLPDDSSVAASRIPTEQQVFRGERHGRRPEHRTLPMSNSNPYRPSAVEPAIISPSDTASVMSLDEPGRRSTSVVSLEDPDVRLAAEALSGLGNPGTFPVNAHINDELTVADLHRIRPLTTQSAHRQRNPDQSFDISVIRAQCARAGAAAGTAGRCAPLGRWDYQRLIVCLRNHQELFTPFRQIWCGRDRAQYRLPNGQYDDKRR